MESKAKTCSKCRVNPASNGNAWCQSCRTEHARETREAEAAMIGARNWIRGGEALRRMLLERLGRAPAATYEGSQVMRWIADFPMPEYPRGSKDTDNRADV